MEDEPIYRDFSQSSYPGSGLSSSGSSGYFDVEGSHAYASLYPLKRHCKQRSRTSSEIRRQRGVIFVCLVFSSFSLLVGTVSLLFQGELRQLLGLVGRAEASRELCVLCSSLKTSSDPAQALFPELRQVWQNGSLTCCASSAQQYRQLFDLMMEKKLKAAELRVVVEIENARLHSRGSKALTQFAHVPLTGVDAPESDYRAPTARMLKDQRTTAHSGVVVLHDRLVITKGGLYFVYSQIYFENSDASTVHNYAAQVLSHYVYRFNNDLREDEMLMKATRTQCWGKGGNPEKHTSYVAATVVLRPLDELYVRASPQRFISTDPGASFFGLVRLGDAMQEVANG